MFFFPPESALPSVNTPHHCTIKHDSPTSAPPSCLPPLPSFFNTSHVDKRLKWASSGWDECCKGMRGRQLGCFPLATAGSRACSAPRTPSDLCNTLRNAFPMLVKGQFGCCLLGFPCDGCSCGAGDHPNGFPKDVMALFQLKCCFSQGRGGQSQRINSLHVECWWFYNTTIQEFLHWVCRRVELSSSSQPFKTVKCADALFWCLLPEAVSQDYSPVSV